MRACTAPEAYAAAAPPLTQSRLSASAGSKSNSADEPDEIPGGEQPLPADPGDFVDEVHRVTDLFKVWRSLLHSKDEKIRQRAVEKLTEMRYKGAAALADEPQRIIIDMPRPNRD